MADAELIDASAVAGLSALRTIDPQAMRLATALCALLAAPDHRLAVIEQAGARDWFVAPSARFHVARISDLASVIDPSRVGDAIAVLDRIDPLLVMIEERLGLSLEATDLIVDAPANAVVVEIATADITLQLAVAADHPSTEDWVPRAAAALPPEAQLPVVTWVEVAGPRLSIAEAAELATGDLVLVAAAPTAQFHVGATALDGRVALATGHFTAARQGRPMATIDNDTTATPSAGFSVPLSIRLPDRMTSAATLAALVPGTALDVGPITDGMPVTLLIAGRPLATGELVQAGDRFAVLIEGRADIVDTPVEDASA